MTDINPKLIPAIAKKLNRDNLANELTKLEALHRKLEQEFSDAVKKSEVEVAALSAEIDRLAGENDGLRSAMAAVEVDHAAARAAWEAADQAAEAAHAAVLASLTAQIEEQRTAIAALEADHASALASLTAQIEEQRTAIAALEAAQAAADQAGEAAADALAAERAEKETLHGALAALHIAHDTLKLDAEQAVRLREASELDEELAVCRAIASKCVFIMGFARSNTTLTLSMLNCADNALILGEADFFLDNHGDNFTQWYNNQHKDFNNQVTKSSYAPSFIPERPHKWWEWLNEASKYYDCVGEKIAISHYHMGESRPESFRSFHEARFISARYIFTLRNPGDVLISSAKLMGIQTDQDMIRLIIAWLDFLELWADSLRVFPRTMTLVAERFGEHTVASLGEFTELDLRDAQLLINPANRRKHKLSRNFPTLARVKPLLEEIYEDAVAATDENRALWQAEQKRVSSANDTAGNKPGMVAMSSRPLGRVWLKIHELRDELSHALKDGAS